MASFSDCAPTMSAMLALAARRCRRSARDRPWSPAPMIFRPRPYARAPSSPTRCRPTLIAARARPEVTYAIERVDEAAHRLGIDRVALRRMNLVGQEAMPY